MSVPTNRDALAGQWTDVRALLAGRPAAPNPLRLSRAERLLLAVAILAGTGVGILGLLSSYTTLEAKARGEWGWSWPWLLPVGLDLAIPAFTLCALLLIRVDMPLPWVRWVPRGLTAATVYLNWSAGHALAGKVGHAVLIGLWVVFSEIAAHVYATRIGAVTGRRMERIRRSRWILAPLSTAVLWRRMVLWEVTSYPEALALERERLLARAALRERYTSVSKAPERVRVLLRLGALTPADLDAHEDTHSEPAPDAQPVADARAQDAPIEHARKTPARARKTSAAKKPAERRRERARALYDELGHRPEWTEIRDALVSAHLAPKTVSRSTCQRLRDAIEADEPALAALGTTNVRTLATR